MFWTILGKCIISILFLKWGLWDIFGYFGELVGNMLCLLYCYRHLKTRKVRSMFFYACFLGHLPGINLSSVTVVFSTWISDLDGVIYIPATLPEKNYKHLDNFSHNNIQDYIVMKRVKGAFYHLFLSVREKEKSLILDFKWLWEMLQERQNIKAP